MRRSASAPVGNRAVATLLLGVGAGLYLFLAGGAAQARTSDETRLASVSVHATTSLSHASGAGLTQPHAPARGIEAPARPAASPSSPWAPVFRVVHTPVPEAPAPPAVERLPAGFVPDRSTAPPPTA